MPKEENQNQEAIIDASVAINKRNEKYPHLKKMTLKDAAEECDVTVDSLVKLKKKAPKAVSVILKLMKIGECSFEEIVKPVKQ